MQASNPDDLLILSELRDFLGRIRAAELEVTFFNFLKGAI